MAFNRFRGPLSEPEPPWCWQTFGYFSATFWLSSAFSVGVPNFWPVRRFASYHFCGACRSAAVKFSPEIVHESCHGKCREISGEISLLLVPQETKLENAQNFSRQISRRFSRDVFQLQMPNFMAFFILQTFVLDSYKPCVSKQCPADGVWRVWQGSVSRHCLLDTV